MEISAVPAPVTVTSVPAFAAAIRTLFCHLSAASLRAPRLHEPLVPMYRIGGENWQAEAEAAVRVLEDVSERLRRLRAAYGEWQAFDAGAYFDLTSAQVQRLVRVSERVSTVHVAFYADLLLPSFQHAATYWQEHFCPAYRQMMHGLHTAREPSPQVNTFTRHVQPQMVQRWTSLCKVVQHAHRVMAQDGPFLAAHVYEEERLRWRRAWQRDPTRGLDPRLLPDLRSLFTLTLSVEFPLPASRQPGRLRRLRANRERRQPPPYLHWRSLDG